MKTHVATAVRSGSSSGDGWNAIGDRLKIDNNDFNALGWKLVWQRRRILRRHMSLHFSQQVFLKRQTSLHFEQLQTLALRADGFRELT